LFVKGFAAGAGIVPSHQDMFYYGQWFCCMWPVLFRPSKTCFIMVNGFAAGAGLVPALK